MIEPRWEHIHPELRAYPQWCIAGPDKVPLHPRGDSVRKASVTDPSTWTDFETAAHAARYWRQKGVDVHVGFVLTPDDPFTCIDLDVKGDTTPAEMKICNDICEAFQSYTEISRSGNGLHVWVYAKKPEGVCRKKPVEVYDRARFIICTGNIWKYDTLVERQDYVIQLVAQMIGSGGTSNEMPLVELEPADNDSFVLQRMFEAENGDKMIELSEGRWQQFGYESQSEADQAYIETLCFYSSSNEQVRNLFRGSQLIYWPDGRVREKSVKNDTYLNRTIRHARHLLYQERLSFEVQRALLLPFVNAALEQMAVPQPVVSDSPPELEQALAQAREPAIPWPPGRAGELARWLYSISVRPVPEVSIVATLGYLAGVYGRAYNVSGSGLNLYVILVARSAIGKEAMHTGLSVLTNNLMSTCPVASEVTCFDQFASAEGMANVLAERQCFVHVAGEWGHQIKQLAQDRMDSPIWKIKRQMLDWYQKSGSQSNVGGRRYSKKEDDVKGGQGLAFSMIGETTPDTFYESLTEGMMADGFMSRFTIVEYNGERPAKNLNTNVPLPDDLRQKLMDDVGTCRAMQPGMAQKVEYEHDAWTLLDEFDRECDAQINSSLDESWRQMWNRAHLKALRVSALLAAIDSNARPTILLAHAEWAINLVRRDIAVMQRKISDGDVGSGDAPRMRKLYMILREYIEKGVGGYANVVRPGMHEAHVVPHSYLQMRTSQLTLFTGHKLQASAALNMTIQTMIDNGVLEDVTKKDGYALRFGFRGRMYRIAYDCIPDV